MAAAPRILALDLNARVGWAYWDASRAQPLIGVERLVPAGGTVGHDLGTVFLRLERFLTDRIAVLQPTCIHFEAPVETGNRPTINAQMHFGYTAITELVAARHKLPCFQAHVDKARKHVIGQARPTKENPLKGKELAIGYCVRRGWDFKDDNGADASVLLVYAGACEGVEI